MGDTAEKFARILDQRVGGVEHFSRNWSWRSHSPKKRAEDEISSAARSLAVADASLETLGASDEQRSIWAEKAIKLWLAYQAAGSRTANPMITGPANFPVVRNQKAMAVERKRGEEWYDFIGGVRSWMQRQQRSAERAAQSALAAETEHRAIQFDGVRLVQNTTLDRIQIVFEGKPDPETIQLLKREAFRWSPRETAWQRKNTNNGVQAAYRVLRSLGHSNPHNPRSE